jgi:uncharacterized protein (TIGR02466 family)
MVENLFSSVIFFHQINDFNKKILVDFAYSEKLKNINGVRKTNFGGWQSEAHYHLTDNPISKTIFKELSNLKILKPNANLIIDGLWININGKGSYNMMHVHPSCDLAGVFWISTPPYSGPIVFENPHAFYHNKMKMYSDEVQANSLQYTSYNFSPKEGSIILFPSYLRHAVEVNESNEDRISVSFNLQMEYRK